MAFIETEPKVEEIVEQDTTVPEFSTRWQSPEARTWHSWSSPEDLVGAVVADGRGMPVVPFFDFFTGRSVGFQGAVKLWENDALRVFADNPAGRAPHLFRFADFDSIYLQFSGHSTIETEYGPVELKPYHAALIPAGVAHRSIGDTDCRRLVVHSKEAVDAVALHEDGHLSERSFTVSAPDAVKFDGPPAIDEGGDWELEATFLWDDPLHKPLWILRRRGELAGGTTGGREPEVVRIFDFFKGMTGKGTGGPGPLLFSNSELYMDAYNTEGDQYGFHRGNGQDELWLQMRSTSFNDTEYGVIPLTAGNATLVPPGISHRIHGSEGFLRLVLYSHRSLKLCVDPNQRVTETDFVVEER